MPKKLEKYLYNKIEFKSQREIQWLVMFDLFGWKWEKKDDCLYLLGNDDIKFNVVIGDFCWKNDDIIIKNKMKLANGTILLNNPKIEPKNHLLGWMYIDGDFVPLAVMRLSDIEIALAQNNNLSTNLLSKIRMKNAKYISIRAPWEYAKEFNYKLFNRTTDKIANKLRIRFSYS